MSDVSQPQPRPTHDAAHRGLRVASWNILHGQQIPPQSAQAPDLHGLANFIRTEISADVIGLQEVDYRQPRSGNSEQIAEIAALLGNWHWGFIATVHGTPGEKWRRHTKDEQQRYFSHDGGSIPQEPQYGIGLISQVEVRKWHVLELGRSRVGMPLLIPAENPKTGKPRARFIYVKDEPRVALAAELANGLTVSVTHLSFVPFVNLWQLWRAKRWLSRLPGTHILLGDFNIPIPGLVSSRKWRSLNSAKSYPSWGAKVKFDYIIANDAQAREVTDLPHSGFSDHLPLVVELVS